MTDAPRRIRDWAASDRRLLWLGLAVAVVARVVCRQGLGYLDSQNYANASFRVLDEGLGTGLGFHQLSRLGMTVPPSVFLRAFGTSETSLVAYFFLLQLADLVVVPMLLARRFAPRTVVAATLLWAFAPMVVRDATTNGADLAMAAWANVAVLLALVAPQGRRARWCLAAGLVLGVGYLHKESAVVMTPVLGAAAFFAERDAFSARARRVVAAGVGFAVPVLFEIACFRSWTGDPLFRYRHIEPTHIPSLVVMETGAAAGWERYFVYWPATMLGSPQCLGALMFALPGALIVQALDRFRACGGVVAFWLLFPTLYTVFGTSTFSSWHPLLPYGRYFQFVVLPAAIVTAQVLVGDGSLLSTTARRATVVVVAAALGAIACTFKFRDVDSAVAAASAALLLVAASRVAVPSLRVVVALLCLVPLDMIVERAIGRTSEAWGPERRAVDVVRARGIAEIRSTSPQIWGLELMARMGEMGGLRVVAAPPDEFAATPPDVALLLPWKAADPVLDVRGADGAAAFEEIAAFPSARFPRDAGVRVLVRRR